MHVQRSDINAGMVVTYQLGGHLEVHVWVGVVGFVA